MTPRPSRLPDFLGIGAQRSGSTWLHELLRSHPQVYLPRRRKEVHYFDWYYDRGLDWYRRFFRRCGRRHLVCGEITPDYLYAPDGPARIRAILPDCRILVLLRDPVERAVSHYRLLVRDDALACGFWQATRRRPEILDRGFYSRYLPAYLDIFGTERVLTLVFEDTVRYPRVARAVIARFLGIDESQFSQDSGEDKVNASFVPRARRLYAAAVRVARLLHRVDADWAVRLVLALGARRLFGAAERESELSLEDRARLEGIYFAEKAAVRSLLRLPPHVWTPEAHA